MGMKKLLIFVITYNAQAHVLETLSRVPDAIWGSRAFKSDMLIIDDASKDDTFALVQGYAEQSPHKIIIQKNEQNQGYGGNQKLGYQYAIEHGYDAVVLLHGDGQYDPALMPLLVGPVISGACDVVLGSRMVHKADALKGGMPIYKFIGNIFLTTTQNLLLGTKLAEFHTGYRVYSTNALRGIPFRQDSNGFVFDTEILIQMLDTSAKIEEIAIPTFYGTEVSNVKVISYGLQVLWYTLLSRLQKRGMCKLPQFEYQECQP